jgi:S-adenosylmethionine:tRNA-ribosyltransferase-isomerase (queuine synthetase)
MSDSLTCRERQLQLFDVAGSTGTYFRSSDTMFLAVLSCDSGSDAQSSTSLNIKKRLLTTLSQKTVLTDLALHVAILATSHLTVTCTFVGRL